MWSAVSCLSSRSGRPACCRPVCLGSVSPGDRTAGTPAAGRRRGIGQRRAAAGRFSHVWPLIRTACVCTHGSLRPLVCLHACLFVSRGGFLGVIQRWRERLSCEVWSRAADSVPSTAVSLYLICSRARCKQEEKKKSPARFGCNHTEGRWWRFLPNWTCSNLSAECLSVALKYGDPG